jgi:hypothetical protein
VEVRQHIEHQLVVEYRELGAMVLGNIDQPVRNLFRVLKQGSPLSNHYFRNQSINRLGLERFADGIQNYPPSIGEPFDSLNANHPCLGSQMKCEFVGQIKCNCRQTALCPISTVGLSSGQKGVRMQS